MDGMGVSTGISSAYRSQVDRWLVVIVSPAAAFFSLAKHIEENVMEELEALVGQQHFGQRYGRLLYC